MTSDYSGWQPHGLDYVTCPDCDRDIMIPDGLDDMGQVLDLIDAHECPDDEEA